LAAAASCKNGNTNAAIPKTTVNYNLPQLGNSKADSLQMAHDIDSADYKALFKNKTNLWLYKLLLNKQNKWENFHLIDFYNDKHIAIPDTPPHKFLEDYRIFLRWSPDSSYMLDIGSYGVQMARDKAGKLYIESGDVDTQVRLHYNKSKTSTKLLFFGPSSWALDAKWIDSSRFAMVSVFDTTSHRHPDTLLWIFDVRDSLFSKYKYQR
jgi:hypothetical protein